MDNTSTPENLNDIQPETVKGQATISFTLESVAKVSVEIYDLGGNKCTQIPAQDFMPGEQQITVNISNLGIPSGKYVYYLQIVDQNETTRECRMITIE